MEDNPQDIARLTAEEFRISRQSVARHLERLVSERLLKATGQTRARRYEIQPFLDQLIYIRDVPGLEEDRVWANQVMPLLTDLKPNVLAIFEYGVTEMLNNVHDHSNAQSANVHVIRDFIKSTVIVGDNGIGIFKKIQQDFNLSDPRHALLELSKGKLTSDKQSHTGEGIFFTSRMFDMFTILSGGFFYSRESDDDQWLIESGDEKDSPPFAGTSIQMAIAETSARTKESVLNAYDSGETDFQFDSTHVPIKLVRYGEEQLVSRSQAKRVLARFDQFKEVFLDFQGVESIGPAFADEIFRVFANAHPDIRLAWARASEQVKQMIERAQAFRQE